MLDFAAQIPTMRVCGSLVISAPPSPPPRQTIRSAGRGRGWRGSLEA